MRAAVRAPEAESQTAVGDLRGRTRCGFFAPPQKEKLKSGCGFELRLPGSASFFSPGSVPPLRTFPAFGTFGERLPPDMSDVRAASGSVWPLLCPR